MTLSAGVLRYVSWLYASKCLTCAITPWLCTPPISATSRAELSDGSSDSASNDRPQRGSRDRKSTRLNSSHSQISYAVFCLRKKKKKYQEDFNKKKKIKHI